MCLASWERPFFNILSIYLRDVLTLVIEVVTSYLSLFHYYKFESNKRNIRASIPLNQVALEIRNRVNLNMAIMMSRETEENQRKKQLLLMTIFISISSTITHFFVATSFLLLASSTSDQIPLAYFSITCFAILCLTLKPFFNIFVFYFLNSHFKSELKNTYFISVEQN